MKLLILTSLLVLSSQIVNAQEAVSDKNIQTCYKHSGKGAAAFDRCIAEEFRRVKEAKEYREARIRAGKDPDGGCAKPGAYNECFEEILSDLRATTERLHELGDVGSSYPSHTWRSYRPYRPYYYYPRIYLRSYYPIYPVYPRFYVPHLYIPRPR